MSTQIFGKYKHVGENITGTLIILEDSSFSNIYNRNWTKIDKIKDGKVWALRMASGDNVLHKGKWDLNSDTLVLSYYKEGQSSFISGQTISSSKYLIRKKKLYRVGGFGISQDPSYKKQ